MRFIIDLVKYFTYITTGIVLVIIIISLLQGSDGISTTALIQIPCAALVTSLVTVLFYPNETKTKKESHLKTFIHYVVLCGVMITLGAAFKWINLNFSGILIMVITTAAVYAFTFAVSYLSSKQEADELNSALKRKQSKS